MGEPTSSAAIAFSAAVHLPLVSSPPPSSVAPLRKPRARRARRIPSAVQQQQQQQQQGHQDYEDGERTTGPPTTRELLAFLKANKERVDAELESCLGDDDPNTSRIISSMRYSLLAGGKRIRPSLVIAAYEMFAGAGSDLTPVMPTALAVEMIHTMSLVHDDLPSMDNDDFRRGKPTNHMVYGEDIAILAGDALLSYAFEYIARNTRNVDPQRVVNVLTLLGESVGHHGLVGGQVMDLENEGKPDVPLDTLTWIHMHKTAALLRVSCAGGAIIGGADEEDVRRVSDFAVKVGLAFQIRDDVLDVTQSTEVLGKTAGKDVAAKKATYPRLLGIEGSHRHAETLIKEATDALAPYGDRAYTLLALANFIINRES